MQTIIAWLPHRIVLRMAIVEMAAMELIIVATPVTVRVIADTEARVVVNRIVDIVAKVVFKHTVDMEVKDSHLSITSKMKLKMIQVKNKTMPATKQKLR